MTARRWQIGRVPHCAALASLCVALVACSDERNSGADVDVNAAAARAQHDIAFYNAGQREAGSRYPASRAVARAGGQGDPAGAVVDRYFTLIGQRHFAAAWRLWDQHGVACGRTADQFAARLGDIASVAATVGDAHDEDAGAGQRHIQVPVRLAVGARPGSGGDLAATATLHRVAQGIETTDPTDHQWRIVAITPDPSTAAPRSLAGSDLLAACPGSVG